MTFPIAATFMFHVEQFVFDVHVETDSDRRRSEEVQLRSDRNVYRSSAKKRGSAAKTHGTGAERHRNLVKPTVSGTSSNVED